MFTRNVVQRAQPKTCREIHEKIRAIQSAEVAKPPSIYPKLKQGHTQ